MEHTPFPLLLLGAALALGCAATPPPVGHAFTCTGRPYPTVPQETAAGVPMGRVEVRLLTGPPGRNIEKTRLRIVAENVPLGVFAGALSDALGVGVVVASPLVGIRIGFTVPSVDMLELFRILLHAQGVHSVVYGGIIHFETKSVGDSFNFDLDQEMPPIDESGNHRARLVTLPESLPAEHFAALFCDDLASPHGRAVVVGSRVYLDDEPEHMDAVNRFLSTFPRSGPPLPAK